MSDEAVLKSAGKYWSKVSDAETKAPNISWGHSEIVRRHISRLVCSQPLASPINALFARCKTAFGPKKFSKGISIGCGNASRELSLIKSGVVDSFDLYEVSEERIRQAKETAKRDGTAERVNFHSTNFMDDAPAMDADIIFWCHSLHHMLDVPRAVQWSHDALRVGGVFVMNDFVGANRFQWSDEALSLASRARSILPEELLVNPRNPDSLVSTTVTRPDRDALIARDPTEAPDSERIMDAIADSFPNAQIILTGGIIYHLALSEIMANFINNPEYSPLLESLLWQDETLAASGLSNFAFAVAERT